MNEKFCIIIRISPKCVPVGLINSKSVQVLFQGGFQIQINHSMAKKGSDTNEFNEKKYPIHTKCWYTSYIFQIRLATKYLTFYEILLVNVIQKFSKFGHSVFNTQRPWQIYHYSADWGFQGNLRTHCSQHDNLSIFLSLCYFKILLMWCEGSLHMTRQHSCHDDDAYEHFCK